MCIVAFRFSSLPSSLVTFAVLVFCVVFCRLLFVLLSVLRFTDSDYPFDIFKLSWLSCLGHLDFLFLKTLKSFGVPIFLLGAHMKKGYLKSFGVPICLLGAHMRKGYLKSFGVPIFLLGAHMKKGYFRNVSCALN